jgi:oligoribonuclease NrnB/cAMP/cGMP phosphodiesterase (DHH superfamily)
MWSDFEHFEKRRNHARPKNVYVLWMDHHVTNNFSPLSIADTIIKRFDSANKNVVIEVTCMQQREV